MATFVKTTATLQLATALRGLQLSRDSMVALSLVKSLSMHGFRTGATRRKLQMKLACFFFESQFSFNLKLPQTRRCVKEHKLEFDGISFLVFILIKRYFIGETL